jgi:hypothetical protein
MKQRLIASVIVALLIALGMWGQHSIAADNLTQHLATSFYQVLMLFFFNGEWTLDLAPLPWQIELVRFVAPLAAITSIILVFASNTQVSISNWFVRYYRQHTVVVGLGDKSWQFLRTCNQDRQIIVIEINPENLLIHRARAQGIRVIIGDVFEEQMFARVNLTEAAELIAFTGNDGTNVELAIKARTQVQTKGNRETHLKIHIHLNEIGLAHQLESYPKFFADYSITEIAFFSVYDLSARLLLRDYPPEVFADVANQDHVHLAIYGFGRLAEKLVIEAALMCQYANGGRLQFTIFDSHVDAKKFKFDAEYPYLAKICDYTFMQQTAIGPHVFAGDVAEILPSITQHIICTESDEESLSIALMLRSALLEKRASNAPILLRMQRSSGLAQLLESGPGEQEIPDGLYPFGMLDQVLHVENVLTSQLDRLARAIHQMYLDDQHEASLTALKAAGGPTSDNGHRAMQAWGDLPQWERKQNMLKADHWPIRLRAIRCATTTDAANVPDLNVAEATLQAKIEHNRYVNTKFYAGWEYGQTRIEEAKINPFLLPWDQLTKDQQQREVHEAALQPEYFASRSSVHTQRKCLIGVTGHRFDTDASGNAKDDASLKQRVTDALLKIRKANPDCQFTILSPLAEGADRLVARLAMEVLQAKLQVPLPLPYDLYVTDFSNRRSVEEFKGLIGQAECYYELPMKFGNIRELASGQGTTNNAARNQQYALAGAYILQRVDYLIAIYDGKPENGVGGTGQIVRWYNEGRVDPAYQYDDHYYLPPQRHPPLILHTNK